MLNKNKVMNKAIKQPLKTKKLLQSIKEMQNYLKEKHLKDIQDKLDNDICID